jgi:hypothetical protein
MRSLRASALVFLASMFSAGVAAADTNEWPGFYEGFRKFVAMLAVLGVLALIVLVAIVKYAVRIHREAKRAPVVPTARVHREKKD